MKRSIFVKSCFQGLRHANYEILLITTEVCICIHTKAIAWSTVVSIESHRITWYHVRSQSQSRVLVRRRQIILRNAFRCCHDHLQLCLPDIRYLFRVLHVPGAPERSQHRRKERPGSKRLKSHPMGIHDGQLSGMVVLRTLVSKPLHLSGGRYRLSNFLLAQSGRNQTHVFESPPDANKTIACEISTNKWHQNGRGEKGNDSTAIQTLWPWW